MLVQANEAALIFEGNLVTGLYQNIGNENLGLCTLLLFNCYYALVRNNVFENIVGGSQVQVDVQPWLFKYEGVLI